MRTIEAYAKGGFASLVIEGKQAFVERYAFGSAFWRERTVEDAPEVAAQLKSNQKDLAEYHYALAQKGKKPEDYTAAARWYRAMLDSFPQDAEAPATRFTLGEVLFESGRFAESAREYEITAYDYPLHAKSAAAGYAALVSYQKHEPTLAGRVEGAVASAGHRKRADVLDQFPRASGIGARADQGGRRFVRVERIRSRHRSVERRFWSAVRRWIASISARRRRCWRTRCSIAAASLKRKPLTCECRDSWLRTIPIAPASKSASRPRFTNKLKPSAPPVTRPVRSMTSCASARWRRIPRCARTPNTMRPACCCKNKQWDRAAQVLEAFRRNYPNHELVPEATRSLAVAYLETGRGSQAAAEFERVAARAEEPAEVRRAALWQAAELYEKGASPTNAARIYADYVKQYPSPLDPAMDARQKLADMAKAQNDVKGRSQWLDEIIRADKAAGASRTDRSKYLAAKATIEGADAAGGDVQRHQAHRAARQVAEEQARGDGKDRWRFMARRSTTRSLK